MTMKVQIIRMNIDCTGSEAGATLPKFPTAQERTLLGRWLKSLNGPSKPVRMSFLREDFDSLDDVVISLAREATVIESNVCLTDDKVLSLMQVVLALAAARGFHGKLVVDRLIARESGAVDGVKALGRSRITCPAGMMSAA